MDNTIKIKVKEQEKWYEYSLSYEEFAIIQPVLEHCKDKHECPVFDKQNATHRYRQLQRWCNNRTIFRSCNTFDEYNRHDTQQNSSQLQIF